MENEGYPKYQYSKFSPDHLEQWVIRSNDYADFLEALDNIKTIIAPAESSQAPAPFPSAVPEEEPGACVLPECSIHHVLMKERRGKDGQTWWDHRWKDEQNQWHSCNGKYERVQS